MIVKNLCPKRPQLLLYATVKHSCYAVSTSASPTTTHPANNAILSHPPSPADKPPLSILPSKALLRSLFFTSLMSPPLLDPCLSMMKYAVDSKSSLLNPSNNPVMNYLLRTTVYNHFCAGENETEVRKTVRHMKDLGFKGVILGYARESVAKVGEGNDSHAVENQQPVSIHAVDEWKEGNLRTLRMIGEGDYLGVKFTGAGPEAVEALTRGDPVPPPAIKQAITEICEVTASQNSRLWIDAEQQIFQSTIDTWTIDLMREFNRQGKIVVYNTIQAYLKSSTENVNRHLSLAQKEGWTLGIKLVRGAYIAHDLRSRIHDTKDDTDRNYNHIVESLLTRRFPLETSSEDATKFPDVRLFVASHNAESVWKASSLFRHRMTNGLPTIPIEVGQLQGMADEVSCELLARNHNESIGEKGKAGSVASPGVFKCLAWGTTEECLHFLLRRAIENKSAMERTRDTAVAVRQEAWRRFGW